MDEVIPKGKFYVYLYGPDGSLKEKRQGYNVVTTVGKEFMASFLYSAAVAASTFTCKYIAIGSGQVPEATSDTAMGTELARVAASTVSYVSGQVLQMTATFATGVGTGSIYEYGVLSSLTVGTLLARDSESVITKGANDTLTVVYQITLS